MDLRHLRYFIAVVEAGSVTDASRRLHVVQPAVSQRIAALEQEVGVQLLHRTRLGVTTTEAGAELYVRAKSILKQVTAAEDAVRQRGTTIGGRVSIGLLRSLSGILAAPLFRALRAQYPDLCPELTAGYSMDLASAVNAARLDIALTVVKPDTPGNAHGILLREGICLLGAPSLLEGLQDGLRLDEIQHLPLIVSPTQPVHEELQAVAQSSGLKFRIVGSMGVSEALFDLCAQGVAAAITSECAGRHMVRNSPNQLAMVRLQGFERAIALYSHPELPKSASVAAAEAVLVDLLKTMASDLLGPARVASG